MLAGALLVAACTREPEAQAPEAPRPVRTLTIAAPTEAPGVRYTGTIEAQDLASLSFRIPGRMTERLVGVGATLTAGQTVARLDPEDELAQLRSARAALATAESRFRQADAQYRRQAHLLERDVTARADYELAEQARRAAKAAEDAARAQLASTELLVGYTVLEADAPGVVTRVGAEPGEIVGPGRMVVQVARNGGRDAVLDVPLDAVAALSGPLRVSLSAAPATSVTGRVREVAPEADAVTRTVRVRVGLESPPEAFRLGAGVVVEWSPETARHLSVPATAVTRKGSEPGVWVVDANAQTISFRPVAILSTGPVSAVVGGGLRPGDIVVTAGASSLRDGQRVKLGGARL